MSKKENRFLFNKKEKIKKKIDLINDQLELELLDSFLYRNYILNEIRTFLIKKFSSVGKNLDTLLTGIIVNSRTKLESKIELINEMVENGGVFDGNCLLKKKKGNLFEDINYKNECFDDIKYDLINISGEIGFHQNRGPGELFLSIMGKNINFAKKSDLIIGDKIVEIKASRISCNSKSKRSISGGRLCSGSGGYSTMISVKKIFMNCLAESGVPKEILKKNENNLNLNSTGIRNLNTIIKCFKIERNKIENLFLEIFSSLLINHKNKKKLLEHINNFINKEDLIDIDKFIFEYGLIMFEYYLSQEGFNYLLLLNSNNGNYLILEDRRDFYRYKNYYSLKMSISWNESRINSISPKIILK